MSAFQKVTAFLALNRNISLLLTALLLTGTGERLWLGFAPKYLQILGATVLIIGLFDALQTLLGALYAYPGGWLTDHWGQRRSLMLFSALSITGYLVVLLWEHWLSLVLGAFLFLAWSTLSLPATFDVIAKSLQAQHYTMGIGIQSMVRRVPMMLGPIAGGWLVSEYGWQRGIHFCLLICIVLTAVTMVLQSLILERNATDRQCLSKAKRASFVAVVRSFSPELRELLVSDTLIRFCERIPASFVVLWAMNHARISAERYGMLLAVEMATAMLCYVPVAHLASKHGRKPFVLATFGFFTLFPITLLWAESFGWLAFAFVVRGLKEFGEPARKAIIIGEALPELRARTYGAYYLIRDCIVTTGSLLGAALWSLGPRANFIGAALCGVLGTAWFYRHVSQNKTDGKQ